MNDEIEEKKYFVDQYYQILEDEVQQACHHPEENQIIEMSLVPVE